MESMRVVGWVIRHHVCVWWLSCAVLAAHWSSTEAQTVLANSQLQSCVADGSVRDLVQLLSTSRSCTQAVLLTHNLPCIGCFHSCDVQAAARHHPDGGQQRRSGHAVPELCRPVHRQVPRLQLDVLLASFLI